MSTTTSPDDEPLFDERITNYPWPIGVFAGLWTFVAGYIVMGIVVLVPDGPKQGAAIGDTINEIGVVLYNAHNVVLDVRNVAGIRNLGGSVTNKLAGPTSKPVLVYYAVPVVVLVVAGALVAHYTLSADVDLQVAVLPGVALGIGYTVTAILGTFVVSDSLGNGAVLLVPDLGQTVVYALAYSLVCGIVGSL
ncbi:MAG: hypothetical protein ABEI57_05325, partial [Halapricum sp.]